eukprot:gene5257-940_t
MPTSIAAVEHVTLNGLAAVRLTDKSGATAEIYTDGAHLASWRTDGIEHLFMSSATSYGGGKAIRGGVPVCFPQFAGFGPMQKHGFARNLVWKVVHTSAEPHPAAVFELQDSEESKAHWDASFALTYTVAIDSPETISMSFGVQNKGEKAIEFNAALHTYFACAHAASVQVYGLEGVQYNDNANGGTEGTQAVPLLSMEGYLDRVYLNTPSELHILHLAEGRHVKLVKTGFPDAVTWNIGEARAPTMQDLGAGEFAKYVCVEAGAVGTPVKLEPNCSWTGGQQLVAGVAPPTPNK